jgi:hypothetical protein
VKKLTVDSYLLLSLLLLSCSGVKAQSTAKDCLPVLAKDYYSYAMKNDLQEDFLRTIDSESFKQVKEDITSKGQAYAGAFSGENDYSKFDESRNKYLENLHYSRNIQQAVNILQITTSERAYTAYETCLRSVASGPALLVWASKETMNDIELHVKYMNGAGSKGIELYGTVDGGSVNGEPAGMIWSEGSHWWSTNENKWGINEEKSFTILRTPGTAETTIKVRASDNSTPFSQTFKRADGILTLSYVGTTDAYRGERKVMAQMPDNHENRGGCPNEVGRHDGKYCTSRTTMTATVAAPRFLKDAANVCNPAACGYIFQGPSSISPDGLIATTYVDNWGSPMQVWLRVEEYEHLSKEGCGGDQKIPVIVGHPVLMSAAMECEPISQILWTTLSGIPSQGSMPFSWKESSTGELVMVGDRSASGSVFLASYELKRLPK